MKTKTIKKRRPLTWRQSAAIHANWLTREMNVQFHVPGIKKGFVTKALRCALKGAFIDGREFQQALVSKDVRRATQPKKRTAKVLAWASEGIRRPQAK